MRQQMFFGDIKNPSGINLFVKLNANLVNTGQATITEAPSKLDIPFTEVVFATIDLNNDGDPLVVVPDTSLNGQKFRFQKMIRDMSIINGQMVLLPLMPK